MYDVFIQIKDYLDEDVKKPRGIKAVYLGDPGIINKSSLPAITVFPTSSTLEAKGVGPGGTDLVVHEVNIGLIWDLRDSFDKRPEEVKIVKDLMETIFERDSSGNLQNDTIIGSIRENITISGEVDFNDTFAIDYGVSDAREFPTLEAIITFEVTLRPLRPS